MDSKESPSSPHPEMISTRKDVIKKKARIPWPKIFLPL
jgi:hypothetical protein